MENTPNVLGTYTLEEHIALVVEYIIAQKAFSSLRNTLPYWSYVCICQYNMWSIVTDFQDVIQNLLYQICSYI